MIISKEESISYVGGGKLTAAFITAAVKLLSTLYEMGQNIGSTINRLITKRSC